jgi:hypothetical protein
MILTHSQKGDPLTRVIATVGTNPLPVLVACKRLIETLKAGELVLLCSRETEGQAKAILRRLDSVARVHHGRIVRVNDLTTPMAVGDTVKEEFLSSCKVEDFVHFHYTGGTKAMGQHAMQALSAALREKRIASLDDSYLDPTDHCVVDQEGRSIDTKIADERRTWNLDITELAELHGLKTEFELRRGGRSIKVGSRFGKVENAIPNPTPLLDPTWVEIAWDMASELVGNKHLAALLDPSNERWKVNWPFPPSPRDCKAAGYRWPESRSAGWNEIPKKISRYFGKETWGLDGFQPTVLTGHELARLLKLCSGEWLEIVVADSLRQGLGRIPAVTACSQMFGSTHFARVVPGVELTEFELDVIAVLGYQLVVISCSATTHPKVVKQKAFEALHRAWQVGGQGARVIVVGLQALDEARKSASDIHIDLGGIIREPIQVWGRDQIGMDENPPRLIQNFRQYLAGLHWN